MSRITRKGYDEMVKKRRELAQSLELYKVELADAREKGDLKENADYNATNSRIRDIRQRLAHLELQIAHAVISDAEANSEEIKFGTRFVVQMECPNIASFNTEKVFTIVGQQEANFLEGLIEEKGDLGQLLLGKKVGDTVEINSISITIKEILQPH